MSSILWDSLAERFNTHKIMEDIHPDAAVNIAVGWPIFFFYIRLFTTYFGKEDLNILDFGCGVGALCDELQQKGHHLTGYDHSKKMLEIAKSNTSSAIKYIHSLDKPLKHKELTEQFDVVTSMHSLEWIEDIEQTLKDISQTLKKEGIFIFAVFPKQHIVESIAHNDLFEEFDSAINPTKGIANFDGIEVPVFIREPEFFTKILKNHGFEKILEYYPQYPKNFFDIYKWSKVRYPEMVIMAYKKL